MNNATSGIIIESGDRTRLHNMAIHDSEGKILSLVLNEGTCCGRVSNTIYDGLVEIKGNGYNFRSTVANGAINIVGCNNNFGRSVFGRTFFTKECENKMVTSNIYHFPQDKPTTLQTLWVNLFKNQWKCPPFYANAKKYKNWNKLKLTISLWINYMVMYLHKIMVVWLYQIINKCLKFIFTIISFQQFVHSCYIHFSLIIQAG